MALISSIIDSTSERSIKAFTMQTFQDHTGRLMCICGCCGNVGMQMGYKAGHIGYWTRTNTCLSCKQPASEIGCITTKTQDPDTGDWSLEFKHRLHLPKTRVVVLCSECQGKTYKHPFLKVDKLVFEHRNFDGIRRMVMNALGSSSVTNVCKLHSKYECDEAACEDVKEWESR
jgi:hypothetical protein